MSSPLAYDVNTAAEVCGVSRDTIVRAINTGALKSKALSITSKGKASKRVILRADLEAWLNGLDAA